MTARLPLVRGFESADARRVLDIATELNLSPWSLDDLAAEARRSDSFMKVLEIDGRTEGFIVGRLVPGEFDHRPDAELYNIGVARGLQREGLGRRLMQEFISFCGASNVAAVWLEVRAGNDSAIAFYRHFGFDAISVRRGFYDNPVEDALVMRADL